MTGSVNIDVNLSDSGIQSNLLDISRNWPSHADAVLTAIGETVVGSLHRDANTNTGRFKSTIRQVDTGGPGKTVVAGGEQGVDYTLPLIHGSEPHAPGPADPQQNKSLARWARRNNYPGGFGAIWGSIYHHGTEEHDFVSPALDRARGETSGVAATVLRNRGVLE